MVFVVLGVLLLASVARGAQEPAVQYDPDSPAGREYELPLPSARSGGGGAPPEAAPLFGAGITPRPPTGADKPPDKPSAGGSAKASPQAPASASEMSPDGSAGDVESVSRVPSDEADSARAAVSQNGLLTGVASALVVLAIGFAVLVAARRPRGGRRESRPPT